MTDINGKTPQEGASDEEASAQTPSSAMSDNEPREDTEGRATTSLDVGESDIHLEEDDSDETSVGDTTTPPKLPAWHRRSVTVETSEDQTGLNDGETPADADVESSSHTPDTESQRVSATESRPDESQDQELRISPLHDDSDDESTPDESSTVEEHGESPTGSESPAESDSSDDNDHDDAPGVPTYTAAIQKLTKAMVSGQLAQKLRGRLAKHSQEVDSGALAEPSDEVSEVFGELGDSKDSAESDGDIGTEDVAETSSEASAHQDSVSCVEEDDSEAEAVISDETEQPEELTVVDDEIISDDHAPTANGEDDDDTQFLPSPPPTPDDTGTDDLPPLQMPHNTSEPGRIKFTRSGLKILNLPAGTQVLSNSLRSARSTFDTLQTGGRIDPTRPTIALFVIGVMGAFIVSLGTLMGTFNFEGFSDFEADSPPPVASSPEAIPEEDHDEPDEETVAHPEISEITVISFNNDGGDHQELADRMIDNDTGTNWQSRYFASPDLPEDNTIRLIITLKESVPVSEVIFTGAIEGGQVDLRVNNGEDPFGGTPLTSAEMGQTTTLTPGEPVEGNTVTLNFVSLPTDDEGRNRVKITELQVR